MIVRSVKFALTPFSRRCVATRLSFPVLATAQTPPFFLTAHRDLATERAGKLVKPGEAIVLEGMPHRVSKITQGKRGKGGGYVKAMLKNLVDGQVFEKTFTSDELVEAAEMEKEVCQYSWNNGEIFSFLNAQTFEEVLVSRVYYSILH
ncbi:hypothetical protein EON64_01605 [archaeon]|nr:MAG: hypothetical protein EON64_01605 [archaeon]